MKKMISFPQLVAVTALLTFILIVIGAMVRVFDAGMSCPEWPLCYGQLIPFPEPAEGYRLLTPAPEGAGPQFYVTEFTAFQVFLEWVHRLLASVVGGLMLMVGVCAFRQRKEQPRAAWITLVTFVLLMSQIKLGALTVWMGNINWSVAAHLGNALLFFAALVVLRKAAAITGDSPSANASPLAKTMAWMIALMVFITMLMGAMVSSSYAGGICGGLFACGGEWLPHDVSQRLHMTHRYLAVLTWVTILAFYMYARSQGSAVQKSARGLCVLASVQVVLGLITLYSFGYYAWAYKALSVAHLGWGTLLFMASAGTLAKFYWGTGGAFHAKR